MKRSILLFTVLITFTLLGQTLDTKIWFPNFKVYSIFVDSNYTYIGGYFDGVQPLTGSTALISENSTTPEKNWPYVDGEVKIVIPDGKGGWYIGGTFTKVGTVTRRYLAQISSTGTVTDWNPNPNLLIKSMFLSRGNLYISGSIPAKNVILKRRVAKISTITGLEDSLWKPTPAESYYNVPLTISGSGNHIYLGGDFDSIEGLPIQNFARVNTTNGKVDTSWHPNPTPCYPHAAVNIAQILLNGDDIYVCGNFTSMGGVLTRHLARFSASTGITDSLWTPNRSGSIYNTVTTMAISGDYLYICGHFEDFGGSTQDNFARINIHSGLVDPSWNLDFRLWGKWGVANSIVATDDYLYIGNGSDQKSLFTQSLLRFHKSSGLIDSQFQLNPNLNVYSISKFNSKLCVGGSFTLFGGSPIQYLARYYNESFQLDTSWHPNPNREVKSMLKHGNDLYIAGYFEYVGLVRQPYFSKIDINSGMVDTNWHPNPDSWVTSFDIADDGLIVGGFFNQIGGLRNTHLAKLDFNTGLADINWRPNSTRYQTINSIKVYGNDVYYSGYCPVLNGVDQLSEMAKLNTITGILDTTWGIKHYYGEIRKLLIDEDDLYAAGAIYSFDGYTGSSILRMNRSTGAIDPTWTTTGYGINTMEQIGDCFYIGGLFGMVNGQPRVGVAKLDRTNGSVNNSWINNLTHEIGGSEVYAIGSYKDNLLIGGWFSLANDNYCPNLALLRSNPLDIEQGDTKQIDVADFTLNPNYPNPFNPSTTISYSLPKQGMVNIKLYNSLGEEVRTLVNEEQNAGAHTFNFMANNLPSGVYFYTLNSGNFRVTKKMVLLK